MGAGSVKGQFETPEIIRSHLAKYIPAGTLTVTETESGIPAERWHRGDLLKWSWFARRPEEGLDELATFSHQLADDVQTSLFQAPGLRPLKSLFERRLVLLQFAVSLANSHIGFVRVYLLPDDVDRTTVDRSDRRLVKVTQMLLSQLDLTSGSWNAELTVDLPSPPSQDEPTDAEAQSLLFMFNNIVSPNPEPEILTDVAMQNAMEAIVESNIEGLETTLYPYQRRSAALMAQREAQPGRVIDPRLRMAQDHGGAAWYYDEMSGTILRQARYYDGVCGGILAEEMGSGKTLICLSLILATKHLPARAPEMYHGANIPVRKEVGSLMDMAAASITRQSVSWRRWFDVSNPRVGNGYESCIKAIRRNPGFYLLPKYESRRGSRRISSQEIVTTTKIYLSHATLVIVPNNLVRQWNQEIRKHTTGLDVLTLSGSETIPAVKELVEYDIILFAQTRFERLFERRTFDAANGFSVDSPITQIHFKRCIVDEGHKLGHSRISHKSNLLSMIECLQVSSRWIVTGTPSQGLFGVDEYSETSGTSTPTGEVVRRKRIVDSSSEQERRDLERIGSIASLYLKMRPWANTPEEAGDRPANWAVYVMQPQHSKRSSGRKQCLRSILNSLIIRHRFSEIGDLLPPVDEKIIMLEGSYQDKLALNLFSMMIIFNSVQSQRTDRDYFFHQTQRKNREQLFANLRQASFFGGVFFSNEEISKAVETAEKFLEKKAIAISEEDESLLRDSIALGKLALENKLKGKYRAYYLRDVVWMLTNPQRRAISTMKSRSSWETCLATSKADKHGLLTIKETRRHLLYDSPNSLMLYINNSIALAGRDAKSKAREAAQPSQSNRKQLAGNTKLGDDDVTRKYRSAFQKASNAVLQQTSEEAGDDKIADAVAQTKVVSTVSAKLSYLIDSIVEHIVDEQIIVFYENENVAFYLAEVLDLLHIPNLIYAKTLSTQRRAQYVATFNQNPKFRVLLMDITQAAFGLDMRSASRVYFINPVLNPQVQAQAIGRVRRISQQKPVSVETLVLKGSVEEMIVNRRETMTQAEHRRIKSVLDDEPIFEWIANSKITSLPSISQQGSAETAPLKEPQFLFGRGVARIAHPDEDLVDIGVSAGDTGPTEKAAQPPAPKLALNAGLGSDSGAKGRKRGVPCITVKTERPSKRVRVAFAEPEDEE